MSRRHGISRGATGPRPMRRPPAAFVAPNPHAKDEVTQRDAPGPARPPGSAGMSSREFTNLMEWNDA
jgi:hypothetical protein